MNRRSRSVKKTPYQRIVRNARLGRGVTLTADEVAEMSLDDAIATRASNDGCIGSGDDETCDAIGCPVHETS